MPTLKTKLTPFWYEPEFQGDDKVKFRLRPLTQRDMIEIDDFGGDLGALTRRAQYEAGMKAITAVQGFVDEDGKDLMWPGCAPLVDRELVTQCGFRAIVAQSGGNWDEMVAKIREFMGQPAAVQPTASQDGLEKN